MLETFHYLGLNSVHHEKNHVCCGINNGDSISAAPSVCGDREVRILAYGIGNSWDQPISNFRNKATKEVILIGASCQTAGDPCQMPSQRGTEQYINRGLEIPDILSPT